jgi:phage baseplate assembly protein V
MITLVRSILSSVVQGAIARFSGSGRIGEAFAGREYFQHYGFTSRPKAGAEGLVLIQGNTVYLIATDDRRYRIALEEGEVALYTDEGDRIHLKRGGEILVSSQGTVTIEGATEVAIDSATVAITATGDVTIDAATSVAITAPAVAISGNLAVDGNIALTGSIALTTGTVANSAGDVLHHH